MTVKIKWWAPRKLNKFRIDSAEKVLDKDMNVLILTDEELCMLINEWVDKKDRITYRTFQNYKADITWWEKIDENLELIEWERETLDDFFRLYKKALVQQRQNLFTKLQDDDKSRQRRAWIIERKFDEWNIRIKQELDNKHSWEVNIKWNLS